MPPDPRNAIPHPTDLLQAWRDVIGELRSAAAPVTDVPEDVLRRLLAPLQAQAEFLEHAVQRQLEFDRAVLGGVLAPAGVLLEVLDQSAAAMRTQAKAFDAAATSFRQASDVLELQASLLERAGESLREPTQVLKAAGGIVRRDRDRGPAEPDSG